MRQYSSINSYIIFYHVNKKKTGKRALDIDVINLDKYLNQKSEKKM
jgi:hypothetical protein